MINDITLWKDRDTQWFARIKWNGYRYSYIYYHLDEEKIIHASFSVAKDSSLLALLVNIMEPKIIE